MIVVTAPTGQIGSAVVRDLLAAGESVRVIARDPGRLPADVIGRVETVTGSHADPAVVEPALKDADALFWLVPGDPRADSVDEAYSGFAAAAITALSDRNTVRVVGISALGRETVAAANAGHVTATLAMDDRITATGTPYRALTCPSFIDNLRWQTRSIREHGAIFGPYLPDLALPMVATRDIAAVAARWLRDPTWTGSTQVPVLGPENLSMNRAAAICAEVLDRPVRYQQVSIADYRQTMQGNGYSAAMAEAMAAMADAKNHGLDLAVARTPDTATPTTVRAWCTEVLKPAVQG